MLTAIEQKTVLVIEDNPEIAHLLTVNLADANLGVEHAARGDLGLELAQSGAYCLIILDLMLPGLDGLELCRSLRGRGLYTPVLMLTAKSSELDRVLGLETGADDYLTKPFSLPELLARVRALIRRSEHYREPVVSDAAALNFGDLCIDAATRRVEKAGTTVALTAKEFDLLWYFATHPERVYSRSQLLDHVWGYGHDGYEHTVNSHINRLRAKIEHNPGQPQHVITVWGVGYRFAASPRCA